MRARSSRAVWPVAPAEHDPLAVLERRADGQQPTLLVEADQVAHHVVGTVRVGDGEGGEDVAADALQILRQHLADVVLEHLIGQHQRGRAEQRAPQVSDPTDDHHRKKKQQRRKV